MSTIAHSDWPDDFPDLLDNLVSLISSSSSSAVHGALQVFVEFVRSDVTEDQIIPVFRQLLPELLNIVSSPNVCFPATCPVLL